MQKRGLAAYIGLKHDTDEEKALSIKMSGCHGFYGVAPLCTLSPWGLGHSCKARGACHKILKKTTLGGKSLTDWSIIRTMWHIPGRRQNGLQRR